MMERKANTYRLYPTDAQRLFLAQTAGACRFVYNLALDQRKNWGKRYKERTGKKTGRIKLPKLGWVAFRGWYALPQKIRNVTISLRAGQWYAAIQWEKEKPQPAPHVHSPVGVDMGVSVFASLSNGKTLSSQNFGKKALSKLARAQRALARKKKGSSNRRKAL